MEAPKPPASNPTSLIYPAALLIAIALIVLGAVMAVRGQSYAVLAAGGASLVAVFVTWPIASVLVTESACQRDRQDEALKLFTERLEQLSITLNMISEQQLLSDRAKSVAFRDKDREAIRRAIQEELHAGDYEAAFALADDIERSFGYKQEADRLRDEINRRRHDIIQRQVNETLAAVDRFARTEQWPAAMQEVETLQKRFPDNAQVQALPGEIEARKNARKKELLTHWSDAVARHDVDGSIDILKKLDLYLSPQEAEAMQETVRGVFKEKLNQLRTQFSLAVQDHHWADAIRIGETIMRDFPNSKIAQECKEAMDGLRKRANEPAAV